jgi:hypothetical protein
MSEKEPHSLDIFGLKPVGEAINTAVEASFDGAAAFLSRICLPAAEEFGLLLRDRVSNWRSPKAVQVTGKAERILKATRDPEGLHAHPRLVCSIIDHGSWVDNDEVQNMWAGLLASSCTKDGTDDSNLIFVNLLSHLTMMEARIIDRLCEEMPKEVSPGGMIHIAPGYFGVDNFMEAFGINEQYRMHRELEHLMSLNLMYVNFPMLDAIALELNPTLPKNMIYGNPTSLALHMYVRCKGFVGSPIEYFGLDQDTMNNYKQSG